MTELLEDLIAYFQPRADVKDDIGGGQWPNEAMQLMQRCQEALDAEKAK